MAYGKADIHFIAQATGIEDADAAVWDNIPFDESLVPPQRFIDLFIQNSSVFEFRLEAGKRIVIDLFLREIVSLFPNMIVVCEYAMKLVNDAKKRKLNGKCDYTICHRGFSNLPHLVAIEAKMINTESILQCTGECASIHYERKLKKMANTMVYGIHSTGSSWIFIRINEEGQLFQSKTFTLNIEHYVKEQFDTIYQLVHYVVNQSHQNSPRSTPNISTVDLA